MANRGRQAVIWTNDGLVYWRVYAPLSLNELINIWPCDEDVVSCWNVARKALFKTHSAVASQGLCIAHHLKAQNHYSTRTDVNLNQWSPVAFTTRTLDTPWVTSLCCPACRTYEIATRFWVVVICPIIKCLTVLEFSFILFDLCLFITIFNFILNYVLLVTFWIFTYHKIWILLIIYCFIWNYWIIYF